MDRKKLGSWGEEKAASYLRRHGYTVLTMNYSCRMGEIDVIAQNRKYIVFVEVKLRKNADFGEAREFVTPSKQARIRTTAELYLAENETERQPRFDVVEIYAPDGESSKRITLNHIEDAF